MVMHSVVRGLNVQLGHLEQKVRAMLDKDQQPSPALFHEKTHLERSRAGEVRALRASSSPNDLDDYESCPLGSSVDVGWQVKGTYSCMLRELRSAVKRPTNRASDAD